MILIKKPGLLTTVQDQGRYGFQHNGVVTSGVMDRISSQLANWLAGNHANEAVLEITMIGPVLTFLDEALVAICGADLSPEIDEKKVRNGRTIFVKKGAVLRFGECKAGCRAYLAISGGCHVPEVLHSKSTYLLAKIGGYHGRPLQKNDQLTTGKPSGAAQQMLQSLQEKICCKQHFLELPWSLNPSFSPVLESAEKKPLKIRILKGKHFYWFNKVTRETFFQSSFQLSSQSDRMGYRLQGAELVCNQNSELLSEAVRFGTIQVPGDGNPIVLMADSQTTGGYPKIAETASIDLPALAQAKPGDRLVFTEISLTEAHRLLWEREERMKIAAYQIKKHFNR